MFPEAAYRLVIHAILKHAETSTCRFGQSQAAPSPLQAGWVQQQSATLRTSKSHSCRVYLPSSVAR